MKKGRLSGLSFSSALLLLTLGFSGPLAAQAPAAKPGSSKLDRVFDLSTVPQFTLSISAQEWDKFLGYYDQNSRHEEEVSANLEVRGGAFPGSYPGIGLGLKGNTSRRRAEGDKGQPHDPLNPEWKQVHFKLNFATKASKRGYGGLEKLNLKWFKDDGTRAKEVYCYDLFRRFGVWTAPRSSYVALRLNIIERDGSLTSAAYGIYQMVEFVNEDYLRERASLGLFKDPKGFLFKSTWKNRSPADLLLRDNLDDMIGIEEVGLGSAMEFSYDLKSSKKKLDAGKAMLKDFIYKLNTLSDPDFKLWIEETMDVELFLKTLAVSVAVGMWDDYWGNANNYFLYFQKDGRVNFIPYDYDNTLGTGMQPSFDPGSKSPINFGDNSRPLVKRILSQSEYLEAYRAQLLALINPKNKLFEAQASMKRLKDWRRMIKPFATEDPRMSEYSSPGWDVDAPAEWGLVKPYRILSGNSDAESEEPNYFMVRAATIREKIHEDFFPQEPRSRKKGNGVVKPQETNPNP